MPAVSTSREWHCRIALPRVGPRKARSGPARAASSSPPSAPPSARRTPGPASSPRTTPRSRRNALSSPSESLLDLVPVIPVVVVDDLATAVPIARALVAGGLPVIELTLRTPVALEAIRAIADEVPEILVGAGTITSPELVSRAVEGGAQFLVSPGTTPEIGRASCRERV